ncbi:MAG: sterol desaturase, partial [Winogradskyella sp.]|nr:sterol desaturase [Winogradskyella sp.]
VNYGLTLSLWDYMFKTNYVPHDGRDIELGFEGDETFPKRFADQELYPFKK